MTHTVVVGAGQAGFSLVETLRKDGETGPITLIGAETWPPYQRPPLSKGYLLGEMARERLFFRPEAWYAERDIALRLGTPVTDIDAGARTLELGGERIAWDRLALTTGAIPNRLPAEMGGEAEGVHTIRTLADIDRLEPAMTEGAHAVVVGGGYIGLEAAAVARKRGVEVTLIEMAPRILGRVACSETADYFRALHRRHGVEVLEETRLERIETKDGRVAGARLADGRRLAADFVVVGAGIRPDTRLAERAGLAIDDGIACDATCRTDHEAIWAAGDCASFLLDDRRMRLESVQNAIDMGQHAARAMMGSTDPYRPTPWFWSDQYDVTLQIAGLSGDHDRIVVRQEPDGPGRSHWYYAGDRLVAVDAMAAARDYMVGRRLIEAGRSPAPERVADTDVPVKSLLEA